MRSRSDVILEGAASRGAPWAQEIMDAEAKAKAEYKKWQWQPLNVALWIIWATLTLGLFVSSSFLSSAGYEYLSKWAMFMFSIVGFVGYVVLLLRKPRLYGQLLDQAYDEIDKAKANIDV